MHRGFPVLRLSPEFALSQGLCSPTNRCATVSNSSNSNSSKLSFWASKPISVALPGCLGWRRLSRVLALRGMVRPDSFVQRFHTYQRIRAKQDAIAAAQVAAMYAVQSRWVLSIGSNTLRYEELEISIGMLKMGQTGSCLA